MRDEQQRRRGSQEELLEPADGVDVEVIRRLVQEENGGLADQGLRQEHAAFHPGGEGGHVGVALEGHPREDRLDFLVDVPAAFGFQGVMDAVEAFPQCLAPLDGQTAANAMVLGQQLGPGPQAPNDLVEDRAAQALGHVLREHCRDQPLLPRDLAAIRLDLSVDQPQERGLARPVAAEETDSLPRFNRQADLIEDQRATKTQTQIAERKQCHWLMIRHKPARGKASL